MTVARPDIATASRVVVKVGSSSLTTEGGDIADDRIAALAAALAARRQDGAQLVLVSSGAIVSGLAPLGLARRPRDLATQQAAARAVIRSSAISPATVVSEDEPTLTTTRVAAAMSGLKPAGAPMVTK